MKKNKPSIWHYVKSYKFNSIFIKNFLLIILPTVLPLILISMSIYNYYSTNISEDIKISNINGLTKIKNMVNMMALESDRLSLRLATDTDIKLLLSYKEINLKDYYIIQKFQNLNQVMGIITTINDVIDSAYVYFNNSDFVLATDSYSMDFEHFPDKEWKDKYVSMNKSTNYWVSPRKVKKPFGSGTHMYLSSFRTISNYNEDGVVIINIDVQKLKSIIDNANDKKQNNLIILNNEGVILYNTDESIMGKNVKEVDNLKNLYLGKDDSFFIKDIDNINQIVTVQNSDYNNWKYIFMTPVSQYAQRTVEFKHFMFIAIITSLLIAIGIAFFISIRVFQPIKNMVSLLDAPNEWDGIIKIDEEKNFNEFKYVVKSILKSMDRTRQMEEAMAERLALLRRAQSVALQAQINPHFLYNTLETINWKAMGLTGGENDVSDMITSLSELLRLSLETENNMVNISTEVEQVKLYLHIQNIRYKDKFEVMWNVDNNILNNKIIKLTIQPIIENAIYHGIKPKKEKGAITITGGIKESYIVIEIKDDGVGLREEEVEMLNNNMKENYIKEDLHIGMRNVNQRIKLFFGEEYGLTVDSQYNKYTLVTIYIPIVE